MPFRGFVLAVFSLLFYHEYERMYYSPIIQLSFLLALVVLPLRAQDTYLSEALQANPEVTAAYEAYQAASTRGTQARALDEPMFSYSEVLSSVQTRTGPQERIFAISQNLPWPGVLKQKGRVADAEAQAAYYRYEIRRREVLENVGLAFIEYAYLKSATDRAEENLKLLEQLKPVVEEKVRAGASLSTSLRLDVELAVTSQELESLRQQRPGLDAQLQVLLGREPDGNLLPWPSISTLPPKAKPIGQIKAAALNHHPRIGLANATIETARQKEHLAGKSKKPGFSLGANATDIGNGGETAGAVTLGVKLPIRRGKYRAEEEEAAAMTRQADASRNTVMQQLSASAVRLHAVHREAIQRLEKYTDELIPASQQAVDLTKEDFRTDKASLTDLIESERVLLDLQLLRTRALADAHKAAWKIRALTESGPSTPSK